MGFFRISYVVTNKMNLLAGSTGFLGSKILKELGDNEVPTLAVCRRAIPNLPNNARELIIDFDCLHDIEISQIDRVYLALGYPLYLHNVMGFINTTLKESLFKVDFNYQLEIAKKCQEVGAKHISLISAVGADPNSWNHYLKIKGMLEREIIKLGFESTNIFRPGHLLGNKFRLDIRLADLASFIVDPFLHGSFKKFRSISAKKLSAFVVNHKGKKEATNYFEFNDFIKD